MGFDENTQQACIGSTSVGSVSNEVVAQKCAKKSIGVSSQPDKTNIDKESGIIDTSDECCVENKPQALIFDINGLDDDKFVNTILNKSFNDIAKQQAELCCRNYSLWKQQSRLDFGFVPLSDFISVPECESSNTYVSDPVELHKLVKARGMYNFLGLRIPVRSQLNVKQWEEKLEGYWDTQLIELIRYGFPMDFNRQSPLRWEDKNHNSALQFPQHVDAYLTEEVEFGAIQGPYIKNPIEDCHFSPFLTREKSNASHRRVIIDLSWPRHASVNLSIDKSLYLATNFQLTFPMVDTITDAINDAGLGAFLYKVDISRAFRQVKIDPLDYDLLGLKWCDVMYFDTCLSFGSLHGTQIFQRLSDAVRFMMHREGYDVINYVDDFVGVGVPSVAQHSYDCLRKTLQSLGLDVSVKKLVAPCTKVTCLGGDIDTVTKTIAILDEKLRRIETMLNDCKSKSFASRQQL